MPLIGSRPYTPADDPATVRWFDPSKATTLTDTAGVVDTFADVKEPAYLLTPAGGSKNPTTPNDFNGKNALAWDGINDMLSNSVVPPVLGEGSVAVYAVFDNTRAIAAEQSIVSVDDGTASKIRLGTSSTGFRFTFSGTSVEVAGYLTGKHIIGGIRDRVAGDLSVNLDGGALTTVADGGDYTTQNKWGIGARRSGFFEPFEGLTGEVIITTDVSLDTRYKIEGYLHHKWGLAANLPNWHPFKLFAPYVGAPTDLLWTGVDVPLADQVAWYSPSDADSVVESSGEVSQWDDQWVGAYSLKQPSGGKRPEWGLGAQIFGKNVMHYAGTLDQLVSDPIPDIDLTEFCMISVGMPKTPGDWPAFGHMHKTDDSDHIEARLQCDPTNGRISSTLTLDGVATNLQSSLETVMAEENPLILSLCYDGSTFSGRVNGGSVTASVAAPVGKTFTVNHIQAGRESNTPKNYQGDYVILKSSDIDLIQKVEGWLAWGWGIPHLLPTGHPYKLNPPTI